MPGAWYPEDRFQRIFLVKRGMPTPKSYQDAPVVLLHPSTSGNSDNLQDAVMQAVHVLNTVTVPMGLQLGTDSGKHSGEGSGVRRSSSEPWALKEGLAKCLVQQCSKDHTQWGVLYDHIQKIIYWRSSVNHNLQRPSLHWPLAAGFEWCGCIWAVWPVHLNLWVQRGHVLCLLPGCSYRTCSKAVAKGTPSWAAACT